MPPPIGCSGPTAIDCLFVCSFGPAALRRATARPCQEAHPNKRYGGLGCSVCVICCFGRESVLQFPSLVCFASVWLAGDVNAIAVGSWQWSCTANCTGATCQLGPGAADSNSRARSWPCDIVARCRPVPICGQRRLRRAAVLLCGRLPRLPHPGTCRQCDAARRDRQLGVPVEDHENVLPPARRLPLSSLQLSSRPLSTLKLRRYLRRTVLAGSSWATPA